ncbi:hypothetical protein [Actinocorallia longicatena]|uniref:Dolichyl-phosphate-mannose-protein mannosyltransferase n=1 Tax=Actinocorallia longicatena TaxID=111803 RepID=A0ABP6Q2U4_9ACTN
MRLSAVSVRSFCARHRVFLAVLAVAFALRVITTLGFRWALWFSDSYDYLDVAIHPRPDPVRTFGYPFLLMVLKPFHSVGVVVALQHLMGLAVGVIIYGLLRRPHLFRGRGLPAWIAALATVPVLLDGNQIQLEHLVLSDAAFELMIVGAVAIILWRPVPTWKAGIYAGLLLAAASLTRTVALPLFLVLVVYLVVRRVNWWVLAAAAAAVVVPLAGYAGWYSAENGKFALSGSDGVFLYSRTMTFADCDKFLDELPPDETPLCTRTPPSKRPVSHFYVWEEEQIFRYPGGTFASYKSDLARDFAKKAIMAQPGDYARTVLRDFGRTFTWGRPVYPDPKTYGQYLFPKGDVGIRPGREGIVARYDSQKRGTRVVEPYAGFMRGYQKIVRLPGTLLGVILLVGLAGIVRRWREFGGYALLPWSVAMALLVIPPATVLFDYRYVLPAVPFAIVAAAMAVKDLLAWYRTRRTPPAVAEEPAEEKELAAAS